MATEKMITLAGKTKMDKLNIRNEMSALDHKQRDYYDSMTDDEKKKFAAFLMIRWEVQLQEIQYYNSIILQVVINDLIKTSLTLVRANIRNFCGC